MAGLLLCTLVAALAVIPRGELVIAVAAPITGAFATSSRIACQVGRWRARNGARRRSQLDTNPADSLVL